MSNHLFQLRQRVAARDRSLLFMVVTALTVLLCECSRLEAAPVTFVFEAVVTELEGGSLDPFSTLAPGNKIQVVFNYDDFDESAGVTMSSITVDLGELILSSTQYNYSWSDNGSGLIGSGDTGDGVSLFCPGGSSSGGCDLATVENTLFAWGGSFSFGGSADIFADPSTATVQSPATALHLAETWNSFDSGEFLISVTHISGLGSPAIVRGTIDASSFSVIPEPTSLTLVFLCLLAVPKRRSRARIRERYSKCLQ